MCAAIANYAERRQNVESAPRSIDFCAAVSIAQFDPKSDLKYGDWSNIDFSGLDIRGYDFTGSIFSGCRFADSLISTTNFQVALIRREQLSEARDWTEYTAHWNGLGKAPGGRHLYDFSVFSDAPFAPELVLLPKGSFQMGSPPGEAHSFGLKTEYAAWEAPQHDVLIGRRIAIGRFAVTFEEFDNFCQKTGRAPVDDSGWGRGRMPVINVNLDDAKAYCAWLTEVTGARYRLPSEAEWEYACRGGAHSAFAFGDQIDRSTANYLSGERENPVSQPVPVDHLKDSVNRFGLHQMHGNVWEWCQDVFAEHLDQKRTQNPMLTSDQSLPSSRPDMSEHVVRGGSWFDPPRLLRSAKRMASASKTREKIIGFRVVRDIG